jgi:hypothetical protein
MQQADAHEAATLVAKLRAISSSADVQAECCKALSHLRLDDDAAADGISAVVAALRHGVDHATLQHTGWAALAILMQHSADNCVSAAAAAGAVEAIVGGLRAHPGDADVQAHGCEALLLMHKSAGSAHVSAIAGAGAVQVIMTGLRRHPDDTGVQFHGWMALGNITADDAWKHHAGNAANAGVAGAVETAVAALKRHLAEAFVLSAACHALSALLKNCAQRAAEAGAAGAMKAVVAALGAFPDDWPLQRHGCAALAGLLQAVENRRRAFSSGAGEAIIAAMRTLAAEARVQASGCSAFSHLFAGHTLASEHAQLVAEATIITVTAMTAHASDGDLQRMACAALSFLALLNSECKAATAAAGGIEASIAALRAHAADALMQTAGCQALAQVCADMPGHQAKAVIAGGIEAVVQALRRHAADANVQEYGCFALANMVRNSRGSVQRAIAAGALDAVAVASATGPAAAGPRVFNVVCRALHELVPGHETAAVQAGVLEALQQRTATNANEAAPSSLIRLLQPAAQQHDARPCTHAGCKRCAAARALGKMCALAGCGARKREGGEKKLWRCSTCHTARYCSEHCMRDDSARHQLECFALRDRQAGASGAAD